MRCIQLERSFYVFEIIIKTVEILQIVSWSNPKPYLPDPQIETNILGNAIPQPSTPKKINKTAAILSSPKKFSQHIVKNKGTLNLKYTVYDVF